MLFRTNIALRILDSCSYAIRRTCFNVTMGHDKFHTAMGTSRRRYEEAVSALNSLQTNASVLQQAKKRIGQPNTNVDDTRKYLLRTGITQEILDSELSVIHVAGTKGKGSTCAFTESVIRQHGFRTGFYSSPHLVAVRERIKINGQPLSMEKFTSYFWDIFNCLSSKKENEQDMPPYFKFLTVMALNIFIKEKVDVAVIEVGIGGELDCTNVLRKPVVVGITSLGLDHTSLLGNTVELIARQKAGIMKPNVPAFTIDNQPGDAFNVIEQRAVEIGCPILVAPAFKEYKWPEGKIPVLGLDSEVQTLNATLAIQLAHTWLSVFSGNCFGRCTYEIPQKTVDGLEKVVWPGRTQTLVYSPNLKFFLDGAHTTESIENCLSWFLIASEREKTSSEIARVLIFNSTGERDPSCLLKPLKSSEAFSHVIFCPNIASSNLNQNSDQSNFMVTSEQQIKRANAHLLAWNSEKSNGICDANSFPSVSDALQQANKLSALGEAHVLVTGSLHLVGCVLGQLESDEVSDAVEKSTRFQNSVL